LWSKSRIQWKNGSNNLKWKKERTYRREPPSFITPHFEFPFIQLEVQATKSCISRQLSKWRITDVYLEFLEPSLPDFEESIGSFIRISREAYASLGSYFC